MSQESEQQSEEEVPDPTPMEKFQKLCQQYYSIIDETSPDFLREKQAIEQAFSHEIGAINNYWKVKLAIIRQEGLFFQQLEDDAAAQNA